MSERGPYGTNEGDRWLSYDSNVQKRLDEQGEGLVLVHEMMVKDGELQECLYVTAEPVMVTEAMEGHVRWLAAKAREN